MVPSGTVTSFSNFARLQGMGVAVGGMRVAVGGMDVAVGGSDVAVGGTCVGVGVGGATVAVSSTADVGDSWATWVSCATRVSKACWVD